jgi:hypothetical protein
MGRHGTGRHSGGYLLLLAAALILAANLLAHFDGQQPEEPSEPRVAAAATR